MPVIKVELALEVTYQPETALWKDLKLVLSDSTVEWDQRPHHTNDSKFDQHKFDGTQRKSNLQVVHALVSHKLGKGNQCHYLASIRYKLKRARNTPDKTFNRNLVKLFGFNGFCAIFEQKNENGPD